MGLLDKLGFNPLDAIKDAYVANRAAKTRAQELEAALKDKQIELLKSSNDADQAISIAQINNSGWKDEWFTVLFSIPLLLAFFPPAVPFVMQGFAALSQMPVWYKGFLGAAVGAAFGVRTVEKAWNWWKS